VGFLLRYDTDAINDGLPSGEGAFIPCSFGLADAYVLTGRLADAQHLFDRLVGLCNDVGLLAEEYDWRVRCAVGNFPQAFSHVALVNTAYNIGATSKPCEQRSGNPRATGSPTAQNEEVLGVLIEERSAKRSPGAPITGCANRWRARDLGRSRLMPDPQGRIGAGPSLRQDRANSSNRGRAFRVRAA